VGALRGEAFELPARIPLPDIEIRERVIVDHQGRGEDRRVNGLSSPYALSQGRPVPAKPA